MSIPNLIARNSTETDPNYAYFAGTNSSTFPLFVKLEYDQKNIYFVCGLVDFRSGEEI